MMIYDKVVGGRKFDGNDLNKYIDGDVLNGCFDDEDEVEDVVIDDYVRMEGDKMIIGNRLFKRKLIGIFNIIDFSIFCLMDIASAFFNTSDFDLTQTKLGEGNNLKDNQKYAVKIINLQDSSSGHEQMLFMKETINAQKRKHHLINYQSLLDPS